MIDKGESPRPSFDKLLQRRHRIKALDHDQKETGNLKRDLNRSQYPEYRRRHQKNKENTSRTPDSTVREIHVIDRTTHRWIVTKPS